MLFDASVTAGWVLISFCERVGAPHGRAPAHRFEPAPEIGKIFELLAQTLVRHDPGIARHVSDRIGAGDEFAIAQPLVRHGIETIGLVDVPVDRVGNLHGRAQAEVVVLARHGAKTAHLPEQSLQHLDPAAKILGNELAGMRLFGDMRWNSGLNWLSGIW